MDEGEDPLFGGNTSGTDVGRVMPSGVKPQCTFPQPSTTSTRAHLPTPNLNPSYSTLRGAGGGEQLARVESQVAAKNRERMCGESRGSTLAVE